MVVKDAILGKVTRKIPSILDYQVHIAKESMFNTPPVFPIYVSMLNLQWLKELGGISTIQKRNDKKAELIYREIDKNSLFEAFVPDLTDRSKMNACFHLRKEVLKDNFENLLKEAGISGLNGHRSVGGYRASMYNALPIESVAVLVEVMQELEKRA